MAPGYNFSAQMQLQAPTNVAQVRQQIQQQLAGMTVQVNLTLPPAAQASLQALATQAGALNQQMQQVQTAATGAAAAVNTLAASAATVRQATAGLGAGVSSLNNLARGATTAATAFNTAGSAASGMARSLATTNQSLTQTSGFFQRLGEAASGATQRFAAFVIGASSFIAVVRGLREGVGAAIDFEKQMNRIAQVSGESDAALVQIRERVGQLATGLGVSSSELVKSSLILAQTGITAKEVAANLETLALAATAPNFSSMKETTEGMIAVMHQFKTDAEGTKEAIGAMNEVAARFAVESADLVTAVRKSGGAFAASGGSLNEFLALFTSIRQTTRESADEIATGMRTIFARTQRADIVDQLKGVGVNLRYVKEEADSIGQSDLAGKFVGPYEAVKRLNEALRSMPSTDPRYAEIVESLGGYRQISRVIPLLQQFEVAERALGAAQTGSLSLYRSSEKAQEALYTQTNRTKESFLELFRTLSSSSAFQSFATTTLQLASGLANVLEYAKPLLPVLLALGTIKLANTIGGFLNQATTATAFARRNAGGPVGIPAQGFNRGGPVGIVPGVGDTDSVPMQLPAGSFVIRKSSVKKIGAENLQQMAAGGGIPSMLTPGEAVVPPNVARRMGGGLLRRLNGGGDILGLGPVPRPNYVADLAGELNFPRYNAEAYLLGAHTGPKSKLKKILGFLNQTRLAHPELADYPVLGSSEQGYAFDSGTRRAFVVSGKSQSDRVYRAMLEAANLLPEGGRLANVIADNVYGNVGASFGSGLSHLMGGAQNEHGIKLQAGSNLLSVLNAHDLDGDDLMPSLLKRNVGLSQFAKRLGDDIASGSRLPLAEYRKKFPASVNRYEPMLLRMLGENLLGRKMAVGGPVRLMGGGQPHLLNSNFGFGARLLGDLNGPSPASTALPGIISQGRKLTVAEAETLTQYSGEMAFRMNKFLRGDKGQHLREDQIDLLNLQRNLLDSGIGSSSLLKDQILYRGIRDIGPIEKQLGTSLTSPESVGRIFGDKGYSSTTVSRDYAKGLLEDDPNSAILRILGKKGAPAVSLAGLSNFPEEQEVLLGRDQRFKILGHRHGNVVVQQLNGGGELTRYGRAARASRASLLASIQSRFEQEPDYGWGQQYTTSVAQRALRPEVLAHIPDGSSFLGSGIAGLAFRTPDGDVIRVQSTDWRARSKALNVFGDRTQALTGNRMELDHNVLSPERPNIEGVLQPTASAVVGSGKRSVLVERLPFVEGVSHLEEYQWKKMGFRLDQLVGKSGYEFLDRNPANIGLLNGSPVIIDPGSVRKKAVEPPLPVRPRVQLKARLPVTVPTQGGVDPAQLQATRAVPALAEPVLGPGDATTPLRKFAAGGPVRLEGGGMPGDTVARNYIRSLAERNNLALNHYNTSLPLSGYFDLNPEMVKKAKGAYRPKDRQLSISPLLLDGAANGQTDFQPTVSHELGHMLDLTLAMRAGGGKGLVRNPKSFLGQYFQTYDDLYGNDVKQYLETNRNVRDPLRKYMEGFRKPHEVQAEALMGILSGHYRQPGLTTPTHVSSLHIDHPMRELIPIGRRLVLPELRRAFGEYDPAAQYARGGHIPTAATALPRKFAAGGSPQDTVPALLTPGEFIFNTDAVNKIGLPALHHMNKTGELPGFNKGGYVGVGMAGGGELTPEMIGSKEIQAIIARMARGMEKKGVFAQTSLGAEDAAQAATIHLLGKLKNFDQSKGDVNAFVKRYSRQAMRDLVRGELGEIGGGRARTEQIGVDTSTGRQRDIRDTGRTLDDIAGLVKQNKARLAREQRAAVTQQLGAALPEEEVRRLLSLKRAELAAEVQARGQTVPKKANMNQLLAMLASAPAGSATTTPLIPRLSPGGLPELPPLTPSPAAAARQPVSISLPLVPAPQVIPLGVLNRRVGGTDLPTGFNVPRTPAVPSLADVGRSLANAGGGGRVPPTPPVLPSPAGGEPPNSNGRFWSANDDPRNFSRFPAIQQFPGVVPLSARPAVPAPQIHSLETRIPPTVDPQAALGRALGGLRVRQSQTQQFPPSPTQFEAGGNLGPNRGAALASVRDLAATPRIPETLNAQVSLTAALLGREQALPPRVFRTRLTPVEPAHVALRHDLPAGLAATHRGPTPVIRPLTSSSIPQAANAQDALTRALAARQATDFVPLPLSPTVAVPGETLPIQYPGTVPIGRPRIVPSGGRAYGNVVPVQVGPVVGTDLPSGFNVPRSTPSLADVRPYTGIPVPRDPVRPVPPATDDGPGVGRRVLESRERTLEEALNRPMMSGGSRTVDRVNRTGRRIPGSELDPSVSQLRRGTTISTEQANEILDRINARRADAERAAERSATARLANSAGNQPVDARGRRVDAFGRVIPSVSLDGVGTFLPSAASANVPQAAETRPVNAQGQLLDQFGRVIPTVPAGGRSNALPSSAPQPRGVNQFGAPIPGVNLGPGTLPAVANQTLNPFGPGTGPGQIPAPLQPQTATLIGRGGVTPTQVPVVQLGGGQLAGPGQNVGTSNTPIPFVRHGGAQPTPVPTVQLPTGQLAAPGQNVPGAGPPATPPPLPTTPRYPATTPQAHRFGQFIFGQAQFDAAGNYIGNDGSGYATQNAQNTVNRNAARAGGPVSQQSRKEWFDNSINQQRAQVERELLSAQRRLLQLLHPNMQALERERLAREDVAAALRGEKQVRRNAQGQLLGTADRVAVAENQNLTPPGAMPRGFWGRAYDNTIGAAAGAVGGGWSQLSRWSQNLDARAQARGINAGQLAFGASFALPIVGGNLSGGDPELAVRSGGEYQYKGFNAAGGLLTGAGVGALIGSSIPGLPVVGPIIGAVVGGLTGLVTSFKQASIDIASAKIGIAMDALSNKLSVLANLGFEAPAGYKQGVTADLATADREISAKAYEESGYLYSSTSKYLAGVEKERRQSIDQRVPEFTAVLRGDLRRSITSGKTPKEALDALQSDPDSSKLLQRLATAKRISVDKVKEEFGPEAIRIERQKKSEEVRLEAAATEGSRVNAFGQLIQALQGASASLDKLRQSSVTLTESFEGVYRNPSRISFAEGGIQRLGDSRNRAAFDLVRGYGGNEGKALGELGGNLNTVRAGLSDVLAATIGQTRGEGEQAASDFGSTFERLFDAKFSGFWGLSPQMRQIRTGLKSGLDQELSAGTRGLYNFQKSFEIDSTALIEKLIGPQANPVVGFVRQANEIYAGQQNEFADRTAAGSRQQEAIGSSQNRVVELQTQLLRLEAEIAGQRSGAPRSAVEGIPISTLLEPFNARQRDFVEKGGLKAADAFNPVAIGDRLTALTKEILSKEQEQRTAFIKSGDGGKAYQDVTTDLERLKLSSNNLNAALRALADSSQRAAVLQNRLGEIQGDRQSRLGFGQRYLSADFEERQEITRGLILANAARTSERGLDAFSPDQSRLVISTLNSLGSASLPGFGGGRADEILRQILDKSEDGKFKLPPDRADEERTLQNALLQTQKDAIEAQKQTVAQQVNASAQLTAALKAMPVQFAAEMRAAFSKQEIGRLESERSVAVKGSERLQSVEKSAGYLRSLGIDTNAEVDLVANNRSEIDKAIAAQRKVVDRNKAFADARAGLYKYVKDLQDGRRPEETDAAFTSRAFPTGEGLLQLVNSQLAPQLEGDDRQAILKNFASYRRIDPSFGGQAGAMLSALRTAQGSSSVAGKLTKEADEEAAKIRARLPGVDSIGILTEGIKDPKRLWDSVEALRTSGTTFEKLGDESKKAADKVKELTDKIAAMRGAAEKEKAANELRENLPLILAGALAPGFASGGIAGMHPGKPRGTDTVPAWLTEGEMVVNRQSTQANRALLEKINKSRGPVHLAEGGLTKEDVAADIAESRARTAERSAKAAEYAEKVRRHKADKLDPMGPPERVAPDFRNALAAEDIAAHREKVAAYAEKVRQHQAGKFVMMGPPERPVAGFRNEMAAEDIAAHRARTAEYAEKVRKHKEDKAMQELAVLFGRGPAAPQPRLVSSSSIVAEDIAESRARNAAYQERLKKHLAEKRAARWWADGGVAYLAEGGFTPYQFGNYYKAYEVEAERLKSTYNIMGKTPFIWDDKTLQEAIDGGVPEADRARWLLRLAKQEAKQIVPTTASVLGTLGLQNLAGLVESPAKSPYDFAKKLTFQTPLFDYVTGRAFKKDPKKPEAIAELPKPVQVPEAIKELPQPAPQPVAPAGLAGLAQFAMGFFGPQGKLPAQAGAPVEELVAQREARLNPFGVSGNLVRGRTGVLQAAYQNQGESLRLLRLRQLVAQSQNPFQADASAQASIYDRTIQGRDLRNRRAVRDNKMVMLGGNPAFTRQTGRDLQGQAMPMFDQLWVGAGIPRFASGGLVPHLAGGGGVDDTMALLTAGEMVVNARSTRANLPLLRSINEAKGPVSSNPQAAASGTGAGLSPEVVQAFKTFAATAQLLPEAFKGFATAVSPLVTALNSFGTQAGELAQALNSFSGQLQVTGKSEIQVTFMGAEVLARIQGEMRAYVIETLRQQLAKFMKNSLPDVLFDPDSIK